MTKNTDIEDFVPHKVYGIDHLYTKSFYTNIYKDYPDIDKYMNELIIFVSRKYFLNNIVEKKEFFNKCRDLNKKYKIAPRYSLIIYMFKKYLTMKKISYDFYKIVIPILRSKTVRSTSGILEVAIMTSPGSFSCPMDCYYCPDQKGYPRSYVKEEPGTKRAAAEGFDTKKQMHTRLTSYSVNGHEIDKLEIIVLGGTWSNYPVEYQREFMRDLYYAANCWFSGRTERYSLEKEKTLNETALVKIIGVTIETRPDFIKKDYIEVKRLISYGVTRVQIGAQTIHDRILKKINRGCYTKDLIEALEILFNFGFKVMIHIMPNLPGTTPELDKEMFKQLIEKPEFKADEWKIYPTSVTTTSEKDDSEVYTVIEKWYREGKYVPYSMEELMEVLFEAKSAIGEEVRIARVFRDIPKPNIIGGADVPHLRQVVQSRMAEVDLYCKCVRCREIKNTKFEPEDVFYKVKEYKSKSGTNYYISANIKSKDPKNINKKTLVGHLRLFIKNIDTKTKTLDVLENAGIVREVHVYGEMKPTYIKDNKSNTQNQGYGSALLKIAEEITIKNNLNKVTVISGVGVRGFYRKNGYHLEEEYMTKTLARVKNHSGLFLAFIIFIVICLVIAYLYK